MLYITPRQLPHSCSSAYITLTLQLLSLSSYLHAPLRESMPSLHCVYYIADKKKGQILNSVHTCYTVQVATHTYVILASFPQIGLGTRLT